MTLRRLHVLLCAFRPILGLVAIVAAGRAQVGVPPTIRPTVTVESGDTGGRFFGARPDESVTHHYYVAAESELWDFAPAGRDEVCGGALPPQVLRDRKAGKLRYVQYTDATFTARAIPNRSLGIMGPVLRGTVGEYLVVTFLNRTDQPLSMHPHGVKYDKDSEGAHYLPNPGRGAAVAPGARFTYVWQLDEASGPGPGEPSSKAWLYHSHVTGDVEINQGLVGAIIVTDPKRARPDGTPNDVDREFATLFMIFDESGLDAAAVEAAEYADLPGLASEAPPLTWAQTQQAIELGSRFTINGCVFGNLSGLQMNEGERTRWYLFALGSERDFHTAHWHGMRAVEANRRTDVIELLPASMKVADVVADNPGTWMFHCHVAEHMREGMFAAVTVHARDTVGVDRSPAQAFLGYPAGGQSLRIDHARRRTRPGEAPGEWTIDGAVTVFEGFAVFNEPVRIELAGRTFEFRPDKQGRAQDGEATFRVKNANDAGVVHGGLMEFEATLPEIVARTGGHAAERVAGKNPGATGPSLAMEVARAHHRARLPFAEDSSEKAMGEKRVVGVESQAR